MDPDERFQGKEYLLADAVKIEHAFSWLKLKWQSLQNLPVKIDKKRHIAEYQAGTLPV
ncbi:hypothetical protein BGZ90_003543 [Linnemannia elongata]|nr:hypothetical protein BGZ90_003543 [Linnemannia elongata]